MDRILSRMVSRLQVPSPEEALAGREEAIWPGDSHHVLGAPLAPPFPEATRQIGFAMGCFWGAEKRFWSLPGVYTTAVGYAGGTTANPTYEEVCSGKTGHTETVLVVFYPDQLSLDTLFKVFWEAHDPTQGMRQGNDVGTQYRSAVFTDDAEQAEVAQRSRDYYQTQLHRSGYPAVTTETRALDHFYYAEPYHQQYLSKNPAGYCGLGGTGVCYVE